MKDRECYYLDLLNLSVFLFGSSSSTFYLRPAAIFCLKSSNSKSSACALSRSVMVHGTWYMVRPTGTTSKRWSIWFFMIGGEFEEIASSFLGAVAIVLAASIASIISYARVACTSSLTLGRLGTMSGVVRRCFDATFSVDLNALCLCIALTVIGYDSRNWCELVSRSQPLTPV